MARARSISARDQQEEMQALGLIRRSRLLDFIVHVPDLPLYDNRAKVGLGLWNKPIVAFCLEAVLLLGAIAIYLRTVKRSRLGVAFGLVM